MDKVTRNDWRPIDGSALERAVILTRETSPEGLDAERLRFVGEGEWRLDPALGHVLSPTSGALTLELDGASHVLRHGAHAFVPAHAGATLRANAGAALAHVAGAARGTRLLLRDEQFAYACATEAQTLRWILTPQYLSRRIFLHHDEALVSKAGRPVSWFRTSMFDTAGLPPNDEGESVFKMAYHSRTEFNICYDVTGQSAFRHALHPYASRAQAWSPWATLDDETTYKLDEPDSGAPRNKHEVRATPGGHTTLFCVFDPAPTGVERHQPGEYSDYEPIERVIDRPEYAARSAAHARFDAMMDELSRAKALGGLEAHVGGAAWALYEAGRAAQGAIEAALIDGLRRDSPARAAVLEHWLGGR